MKKDNNMMLGILVFLLTISYCTGYTLTTSSDNATIGLDFTFTCVTTNTSISFARDSTTVCTITNSNTDDTCVLDGGYITDYTYTCNRTTDTYTVTIPGSYVTDKLHGTAWKCQSPFGGGTSNTKILYVNVPISSVTLLSTPTDNNPVEVVSNRDQTFSCTTNAARPSSRIQWYLSTTNITTSASPQPDVCNTDCSDDKVISSSVLTYTGNINDDGRILYCTAINIEGQEVVRSSDKTIVIWYGPNQVIITPSIQSYTLNETENLNQIQCTADCIPVCTMTWSGPNLPAGITSVLNLQNINRNQTGNYQCTASNDVNNKTSVVVNVAVQYGPNQVIITPSNQYYTLNETENLNQIQCTADCIPVCTMTWSGPNLPAGITSVLNLQNINRNQTGNYQCTASNDVNNKKSVVVNVAVQYGPNQVIITPSNQSYTLNETENLNQIQCTADCIPVCTMTWSGPNLPAGITSVLNLQNINRNQTGNYQCTASNDVNNKTSVVVNVAVQYGPNQVIITPSNQSYTLNETENLNQIQCTADCIPVCTMTWSGPNLPAGITSVLNLQNINRNQAGDYQCTASNDVNNKTSVVVHVVVKYGPIQIEISPPDSTYTVTETDSVNQITCTADCNPSCTTTWTGHNLSAGSTSILNLQNIDRSQAGVYNCTAVNEISYLTLIKVNVIVNYGPRQVVIYPTTFSYTRNETLDSLGPINCTANCKPDCTSTWNGPNLPPGTTSVLSLANINRNQAGNYQCTASNDVRSLISATIYVVVNYQSTISSISNNKVINENDTATIKCTVYSIPQSTIRWIFETNELQNKYDGSLTLNKIDCLSMGRYTCQAVNMLGVDNRSVDVTVKCSPRINYAEFTMPSTITIKDGEMLNITAHIIAFPKPEMYWQFGQNGLNINVSSGISNSFNINRHSSSLVKRNLVETDFGIYRLYAYNGVGSTQYFLHSFIVLPEKPPTSPTVVFVVCQTTSSTVLWKPEMNGGSTQTFFVKFWSLSQSSHAKLTPAISDPGSDSDVQYLINNLVPETIYTFQIIARNVYGDSLSKSVNCTTNERQYLTPPTSSDQSGLFTAGISCLIIGLLSIIFAVSFVIYCRFRPQKRKRISNNDYTEFKTCNPRPVVTDQYDILKTTIMGTNDEHVNQTDRNSHTYEECQPSNNTDRTHRNQNIQSTGATKKKEHIYDNMTI